MKRSTLSWVVVLIALFAAVTIWRRSGIEPEVGEASGGSERVRAFWTAYQGATKARLRGHHHEAAAGYREALEIDPEHQDSLFYLAISLEAEGRYRESVEALRDLVELYPEHGRGWSQLGTALATRAPGAPFDLASAEEAFRRSEAINREHSGPFVARGRLALERGELEEALDLFGIAAGMGSPEAHFYVGLVELRRGRPEEAIDAFVRVFDRHAKERAITGKGASSEGDVEASILTPLESAYLRARVFAYWASRRVGGYPETIAEEDRLELPEPRGRVPVREVEGKAVVVDLDGDGALEIVWCSPSGLRSSAREAPLTSSKLEDVLVFDADGDGRLDLYGVGRERNVLLRNEGGDFVDVTHASGLEGARATWRAVTGDLDGDGKIDLLEVGDAPAVRLYLRRGERYEEAAEESGLGGDGHLVDAATADVNGDGRLDVFLLGWRRPGRLFLRSGERFEERTRESGLEGVGGDGLRALFFDADADGDPDLLVTAHAPLALSLARLTGRPTRLENGSPRLFRNDAGRFTEITSEVGLDRAFGVVDAEVADVDRDGFTDLLFAHGGFEAQHLEPSLVLRNVGGRELVEWAYLPSIDAPRRVTGIASGDLDGDGQVEVVLSVAGKLAP